MGVFFPGKHINRLWVKYLIFDSNLSTLLPRNGLIYMALPAPLLCDGAAICTFVPSVKGLFLVGTGMARLTVPPSLSRSAHQQPQLQTLAWHCFEDLLIDKVFHLIGTSVSLSVKWGSCNILFPKALPSLKVGLFFQDILIILMLKETPSRYLCMFGP